MLKLVQTQLFLVKNRGISKISILQDMLRMREINLWQFRVLLRFNKLRPWDN